MAKSQKESWHATAMMWMRLGQPPKVAKHGEDSGIEGFQHHNENVAGDPDVAHPESGSQGEMSSS